MRLGFRAQQVAAYLLSERQATYAQLAEALGYNDQRDLRRTITRLEQRGMIQRDGRSFGRGRKQVVTATAIAVARVV